MNDDISNDVVQGPDFTTATKAWTACMTRNGYSSADPDTHQQALNVAVRQFKAAYAKELSWLPALLRTASATPGLRSVPGKRGAHG